LMNAGLLSAEPARNPSMEPTRELPDDAPGFRKAVLPPRKSVGAVYPTLPRNCEPPATPPVTTRLR